jgi:hypothetical protein
MEDRKVRDTSTKGEAMLTLANSMITGSSKAIEDQEARGQADFVNSTQLPVRGSEDEAFTKMGIRFAIAVEGELFRHADLPEGWSKKPTDHSMWSHLVDDKGNVRASIFYKAAFYDRDAFMRPCGRFVATSDYDYEEAHPNTVRVCVFDKWGGAEPGKVRFHADADVKDRSERYKKQDALRAQCEEWLSQHYPEWQNASAYWDAE